MKQKLCVVTESILKKNIISDERIKKVIKRKPPTGQSVFPVDSTAARTYCELTYSGWGTARG